MDGKLDLLADNLCGAFEPMTPGRAGSFSTSIWRTTDGRWGARYGIGETRIDPVLQLAVHAAVSSHQAEKMVRAERERCAEIALAIDSGRGNEKEIARAIRAAKP